MDPGHTRLVGYRIRGNVCGMKFSLNRKQTGFSWLYFRGSQVHRGEVACYVLLQMSNCCKLANFHGLNFHCICRWLWNPRNLHTAEISAHTVLPFNVFVKLYTWVFKKWYLEFNIFNTHQKFISDTNNLTKDRKFGMNICNVVCVIYSWVVEHSRNR